MGSCTDVGARRGRLPVADLCARTRTRALWRAHGGVLAVPSTRERAPCIYFPFSRSRSLPRWDCDESRCPRVSGCVCTVGACPRARAPRTALTRGAATPVHVQGWCSKVASWAKNCTKSVTTCQMSMNQTQCCATNMCTWTPLDSKEPVPCTGPEPPEPPEPPTPPPTFSCEFTTAEECDANACCNWWALSLSRCLAHSCSLSPALSLSLSLSLSLALLL